MWLIYCNILHSAESVLPQEINLIAAVTPTNDSVLTNAHKQIQNLKMEINLSNSHRHTCMHRYLQTELLSSIYATGDCVAAKQRLFTLRPTEKKKIDNR